MTHSRTRILVVRHGQSTWNAEGRWQGQADPPLSTLGETQAATAAGSLDPFDAIAASDLQRAARTATIIAEHHRHGPVALDERLRERHAGDWQGLTHHEVESGWPGWLADGRRPAGFEPSRAAGRRALDSLADLARRHRGHRVLVVSHGGILRAVRKVLGVPGDMGFANLSGQWFEVGDSEVSAGDVVSLLEDGRPVHGAPL